MCPAFSPARCARTAAWLTAAASIALSPGCDIFGALQGGEGLPCTTSAACPRGSMCMDGTCRRTADGSARADGATDAHEVDAADPARDAAQGDGAASDGAQLDGARVDGNALDRNRFDGASADSAVVDGPGREGGASDRSADAATGFDASASDGASSDATGLDASPPDGALPDAGCSAFQCRVQTGECVPGTQDRQCGQNGDVCEDCPQRNSLCGSFSCIGSQCTSVFLVVDATPCGTDLECWAGECTSCVSSHDQACAYSCAPLCTTTVPAVIDCLGRCAPNCACAELCAGAC